MRSGDWVGEKGWSDYGKRTGKDKVKAGLNDAWAAVSQSPESPMSPFLPGSEATAWFFLLLFKPYRSFSAADPTLAPNNLKMGGGSQPILSSLQINPSQTAVQQLAIDFDAIHASASATVDIYENPQQFGMWCFGVEALAKSNALVEFPRGCAVELHGLATAAFNRLQGTVVDYIYDAVKDPVGEDIRAAVQMRDGTGVKSIRLRNLARVGRMGGAGTGPEYTRCFQCGKSKGGTVKLRYCAKCKACTYCSAECQKEHWKAHKSFCCSIEEPTPAWDLFQKISGKDYTVCCQNDKCAKGPAQKGGKYLPSTCLRVCSKCKACHYCSHKCATADWKKHKVICEHSILQKALMGPELECLNKHVFQWIADEKTNLFIITFKLLRLASPAYSLLGKCVVVITGTWNEKDRRPVLGEDAARVVPVEEVIETLVFDEVIWDKLREICYGQASFACVLRFADLPVRIVPFKFDFDELKGYPEDTEDVMLQVRTVLNLLNKGSISKAGAGAPSISKESPAMSQLQEDFKRVCQGRMYSVLGMPWILELLAAVLGLRSKQGAIRFTTHRVYLEVNWERPSNKLTVVTCEARQMDTLLLQIFAGTGTSWEDQIRGTPSQLAKFPLQPGTSWETDSYTAITIVGNIPGTEHRSVLVLPLAVPKAKWLDVQKRQRWSQQQHTDLQKQLLARFDSLK